MKTYFFETITGAAALALAACDPFSKASTHCTVSASGLDGFCDPNVMGGSGHVTMADDGSDGYGTSGGGATMAGDDSKLDDDPMTVGGADDVQTDDFTGDSGPSRR